MKVPLKHDLPRIWLMFTNPRYDDRVAEAADVDVAAGIHFREGEEGDIESATIVEIELVGLVDHGVVVLRAAGIRPGDGAPPM